MIRSLVENTPSESDVFQNEPENVFRLGQGFGRVTREQHCSVKPLLLHSSDDFWCVSNEVTNRQTWLERIVMGRQEFALYYRLSGKSFFKLGDHEFTLEGGSFWVCIAPQGEELLQLHASEGHSGVMMLFSVEELRRLLGDTSDRLPRPIYQFLKGQTPIFHRKLGMTALMSRAARELASASADSPLHHLLVRAQATELLWLSLQELMNTYYSKRYRRRIFPNEQAQINGAKEILDNYYYSPPTTSDLAKSIGLSEEKLCYGFQQLLGSTVQAYILKRRMIKATELLKGTGLSITQIALDVGYAHGTNFTRAFRKYYGVSPLKIRKN